MIIPQKYSPRNIVKVDMVEGKLIVFEGPDGVGKTSLQKSALLRLEAASIPVIGLSFPGSVPGTLGELVYRIHHAPESFDLNQLDACALQTLHIAAHIDSIKNDIKTNISSGVTVLLDRFWWSTWVYGVVDKVSKDKIGTLVKLEQLCWGTLLPDILFLINNDKPFRAEYDIDRYRNLKQEYSKLSEQAQFPVTVIQNENNKFKESVDQIYELLKEIVQIEERLQS